MPDVVKAAVGAGLVGSLIALGVDHCFGVVTNFVTAHPVWTVFIGFAVAGGVGSGLADRSKWFVNQMANAELENDARAAVPPWIIGCVEQTFFALAVALLPPTGLAGVLPAMMLWVAAKMAANWEQQRPRWRVTRGKSIRALAAGLASLGVALAGGLIARWGLFNLGLTYLRG